MRQIRVLVLLIIMSFIMPGCLDSVGDSEVDGDSSINQQPVFYSWGYTFQYENNDDGTLNYSVFHLEWQFSVIDFDGTISEVGIDTNLDGIIDHDFISDNWSDPEQIFELAIDYENATFTTEPEDFDGELCYFALNLIAVDNDGVKSVEPYTKVGYCENPIGPTYEEIDYSMYDFGVTDAAGTPTTAGGEDLVYVAMEAGEDLSWATVIVQMSAGGSYTECTNPDQTANTGCAVSDNGDGKWAFGEEITVSEGSDSICDTACSVQVKVLDRASNKLIYESTVVNVI